MLPIQLIIKGIYSYRTEQRIDFTNLARGGVFGIFGPVGSGKSAILDAIMYALFGETERLSQKDSRQYNMMNLQSNEMLIDFTFGLSSITQQYRCTVKAKRSKKHFDKVDSPERAAYKMNEQGQWEPIPATSISTIIGLSYDNFKRTVIIPQGQCMEFIQLSAGERTRMMKDLFMLDKYDLSAQTSSLEKQNDEQRNVLKGRLQELGDYSPEQIVALQDSLAALSVQQQSAELRIKELQQMVQQQDAARQLQLRFQQQQQQLQDLEQQLPHIANREQQLARYEWCKLHFAEILNQHQSTAKRLNEQETILKTISKEFDSQQSSLQDTQKMFIAIQSQFEQIPQKERLVEQLQTLGTIHKLAGEIAELEQRIAKGQKTIQDTVLLLTDSQETIAQKSESLKNNKQELPDINTLWQTHNKLERLASVEQELDKTKKSILQFEDDIRKLQTEKEQQLQKIGLPYPLQPNSFELAEQQYLAEIAQLEQELETHLVKQQLHRFAETLTEGDACPLCGSMHHPSVFSAQNAQAEQQQIKAHIASLRQLLDVLRKTQTTILLQDKEQSQLRKSERELSALLHPLAIERNCLQTETLGFDREQIVQQLQHAQTLKERIERQEKELEKLQLTHSQLLANEKKYDQALQQLKTDCEAKRTAYTLHHEAIAQGSAILYLDKPQSELESVMQATINEIAQTRQQYNTTNKKITDLQSSTAQLTGQINTIQVAVSDLQTESKDIELKLHALLKNSEYSSKEETLAILRLQIDIAAERTAIQTFQQQLHHARQTMQALQQEHEKLPFDENVFQKTSSELQSISDTNKQLLSSIAQQTAQIVSLQQRAQTGAELLNELQTLDERAQNLQTLRRLFYGNGFVNYVSTNYLKNLCLQANQRFLKLSKQKMQLEIDNDNAFVIRDFMNNGQLRSIKTLSGGQTFQAALCLALALSDSVQLKHQHQQNFFFIDEGFGSLDKDSLRLVFDTLKALRQENRIVGIISHVEELKEEIPSFLQIQNTEEQGSFLAESYR